MHNKPYTVDASKITRVLPDFSYIPLQASVKAAADSVVAMGLAAFHGSRTSSSRCCWGWLGSLGLGAARHDAECSDPAAAAVASAVAAIASAKEGAALVAGEEDIQLRVPDTIAAEKEEEAEEVLALVVDVGPSNEKPPVLQLPHSAEQQV